MNHIIVTTGLCNPKPQLKFETETGRERASVSDRGIIERERTGHG